MTHFHDTNLTLRFSGNSYTPRLAYSALIQHRERFGLPKVICEFDPYTKITGAPMTLDHFSENYVFSGFPEEVFSWGQYQFSFLGGVPKAASGSLSIRGSNELWVLSDELVKLFSIEPQFLQAYVLSDRFNFFQNCTQLASYRVNNESTEGLVMRNLGFPPPLDAMCEIDISKNPGRTIRHAEYDEVVAAKMWFSESFFALVRKTKRRLLMPQSLALVEELIWGVVKVTAANKPFSSIDSRTQMDSLRKAIYES
jgi:hypothetical protein